jgi:hypothetical protein
MEDVLIDLVVEAGGAVAESRRRPTAEGAT